MNDLFIASDHRGYALKNKIKLSFPNAIDLGPDKYNPEDDYNDFAKAIAKKVLAKPNSFGIVICGSAIGVSIQCNRYKGIRAAVVSDIETAKTTREHNNANIICLSADKIANSKDPLESEKALEDTLAIIETFLNTPFSKASRHERRIKKLDEDL